MPELFVPVPTPAPKVPLGLKPEPLVAPFTPPFTEPPVVVLPVDRPPPVLGPA